MRTKHSPQEIRKIVQQAFERFGVHETLDERLIETIRVERGEYAARCYRAGQLMAMWLISAGVIQLYDSDGKMLETIRLWQERSPSYQAA